MRTHARAPRRKAPAAAPAGTRVYRSAAQRTDRGLRALLRAPPAAQRACAECEDEKTVQRAASGPASRGGDVSSTVAAGTASGGAPLPAATRHHFEPRFGRDFGGVRVHTGTAAAVSARELNARAYTFGQDIVFGARQYDPGSAAGQRLLAHELAHVVQQEGAPAGMTRRAPDLPACEAPDPAAALPPGTTLTFSFPSCSKEKCAGKEGSIDADLERALAYTAGAVSALEGKRSGRTERLLDWFFNDHSDATADKIRELLGHVREALKDTRAESRYVCSTRDSPIARTGSADKWCVDSQVPICLFAPYFGDSAHDRAVTLIHESGHRIGLSSGGLGVPDIYAWQMPFLSLTSAQSIRNTDSYAHFAGALAKGEPTTILPQLGAQGGLTSTGGGFGWLRGSAELQHPELRNLHPGAGATIGAFNGKFITSAFVSLRLGDARPNGRWSVYADLSGGLAFIGGDKAALSPTAEARLGVRIGTLDVALGGGLVRDRSEEEGASTVYTGGLSVSWIPDFYR